MDSRTKQSILVQDDESRQDQTELFVNVYKGDGDSNNNPIAVIYDLDN